MAEKYPAFLGPIDVPDGHYTGFHGGYWLRSTLPDGREFRAKTVRGIRTPRAACEFDVVGGKVDEESIKYESTREESK